MPLVKLFCRNNLTKHVPLAALQQKLCDIWGTKPGTTKLMLFRTEAWTDESFQEDVYVDIRAYGAFGGILKRKDLRLCSRNVDSRWLANLLS